MLQRISIQNYAIIEEQDIQLSHGLNIITGETGAGKSIILDALSLVMGERAESRVLSDKGKKAVVEATFVDYPESMYSQLTDLDLDIGEELIFRREILPSGKSRAFVNDTPVRLDAMKMLSAQVVDLHQQFEALEIQRRDMQYAMLDAFAGHLDKVKTYAGLFRSYTTLSAKVRRLEEERLRAAKERDYVEFQLAELNDALPEPGKVAEWEEEYAMQDHAEEIKSILNAGVHLLRDADVSVAHHLRDLTSRFDSVSGNAKIDAIAKRITSSLVELEDIADEMNQLESEIEPDPERKVELEEQLDAVRKVMLKYAVQTEEELAEIASEYQKQLDEWQEAGDALEQTIKERDHLYSELEKLSTLLYDGRRTAAGPFAEEVNSMLHELEMKNARFEITLDDTDAIHEKGRETIEYVFAANLGSELQPVGKVASGGELSRLSLCIKTVACQRMQLPSMIFDEIDAGVSGQVARKMGRLLRQLATEQQVIMVTHSPQVAAQARLHLKVSKHDTETRSIAQIRPLEEKERVEELAKMLSGDPPTEAAILNARELIQS